MLIESSAIVAILLDEPERDQFVARIRADPKPMTTVVNMVEAALGVGKETGHYVRAAHVVQEMLSETGVAVHDFPSDLFQDVVGAFERYGKGTGHPAKLNFGDCFSYAMAKRTRQKLLYKGNDFSQTDLA